MPSMPSSARPDFTSSSLNGLMIASIFFMSGNHPTFLQGWLHGFPLSCPSQEKVRGSATPSKSTSSQGTHAHGLLNLLNPLNPLVASPPCSTLTRELTFGPLPNEPLFLGSNCCAKLAFQGGIRENPPVYSIL